ncbi:GlxA family transcriptional regulator [Granulosicoccus sp. 3-233]|uniref:GlxA family transcriptional regulator n=1 Tax=Granulosicoccus sp. 3-233 TaxID=3417969 RepID=UPI003D343895
MKAPTQAVAGTHCPITVEFVLLSHFSLLSFTAAADALTTANLVSGQPLFAFRTIALTEHSVVSDLGIHLTADSLISQSELPPNEASTNIVLICGGYRCDLQEDPQLSNWLRLRDQQGTQLGGLWNGILAVSAAGLMTGYGCALHPDNHTLASMRHPHMTVRPDTLVVDRTRWSAAGPSSAFELMLMLIGRHDSAETVHAIRQILKADTMVSADSRPRSWKQEQAELPANLQSALRLMRNNLDEPVSKLALAQHINLSTRAMERLFQRHLNTSPARFYRQLRLQRAHELLSQGDASVGEVSDVCGFVSAAHFSRSFQKRYGVSPSDVLRSTSSLLDMS